MTTTNIITIGDLVESVRHARAVFANHAGWIKAKREEFERSIAPESDLLREFKEQVEEAERQLRAAALAQFKADGNKKPHPSVNIREASPKTSFEYSEMDALKYALEHGVALQLDAGLFEAYMQALPEPSRPSWFRVKVTTPDPTAAIAREIPAPETKPDGDQD